MTTLLNVPADAKPDKSRALIFTVVAILCFACIGLYFLVRYYPEKKATEDFFNALASGDTDKAYQIWKPGSSYTKKDFLADWGPAGYYGPVKSFALLHAKSPVGASGVIITVAVSPFSPLPNENSDPAQSQKPASSTSGSNPKTNPSASPAMTVGRIAFVAAAFCLRPQGGGRFLFASLYQVDLRTASLAI